MLIILPTILLSAVATLFTACIVVVVRLCIALCVCVRCTVYNLMFQAEVSSES